MTASISSLLIGLFRFSMSSCCSFVVCGFPGMHPFLLDCLIYWLIAAYNMLLKSFVKKNRLYFLGIGDLSFLSSDFINLSLFSLPFNKNG